MESAGPDLSGPEAHALFSNSEIINLGFMGWGGGLQKIPKNLKLNENLQLCNVYMLFFWGEGLKPSSDLSAVFLEPGRVLNI